MRHSPVRVAMVAGEASGDLLAGLLLEGLVRRWPDLQSVGIGGPEMVRQGLSAWWPHHKLTVHGYSWDLVWRYPEIVGIRHRLLGRLLLDRPDVFIGIDAPDFNLSLEARLKAAGIPTVQFVCPSVWAWRAERLLTMRHSVDHVLCLFPFEPALLAQHGIEASYVGHPLAQVIPMIPDRLAARRQLGVGADAVVVALLPGSRASEINHLAHRFFQAAFQVAQREPSVEFVVPAVPSLYGAIEQVARSLDMADRLRILHGQSHAALAACDLCLVASGTATLEAALFKRPMVIAYRMSRWSWRLVQGKRLQPWVGLPNILSGESLVPELLQDEATPSALAGAVLAGLAMTPQRRSVLEQRFTDLHADLQRNTAELAADAIEKVLPT
ncbi:MAG: lipid-A-disaccharide synthase [Rhodoferax sp.]|nr:lipid-A-disaccharide synthase [Rhodoferax sp.]